MCEVVSEEFFAEVCDYVIETKEDWENFLKEHHYDPKSRTIKINGRTVHIETRTSENFGTGKDTSKEEDKRIKKYGKRAAKYDMKYKSRKKLDDMVIKGQDIGIVYPVTGRSVAMSNLKPDETTHGKIFGIVVNLPKIYELNKRQINYAIQHEVGHVDDLSASRRADKVLDFFVTTPYTKIPKEYISDFKKCRKIAMDSNKKDEIITVEDKRFVDEVYKKISHATGLKRSKEDSEANDYSDVSIASDMIANLKRGESNHTNDPREIRADFYAKIKDPSIDIENDNSYPKKSENRARKKNVDDMINIDDGNIKKKAEKYMK